MTNLELILSVLLAAIYVACIFTVAINTFRNGHWILGILGIAFPVFWLFGAAMRPTGRAVIAE